LLAKSDDAKTERHRATAAAKKTKRGEKRSAALRERRGIGAAAGLSSASRATPLRLLPHYGAAISITLRAAARHRTRRGEKRRARAQLEKRNGGVFMGVSGVPYGVADVTDHRVTGARGEWCGMPWTG
jgi:hypothetical protein